MKSIVFIAALSLVSLTFPPYARGIGGSVAELTEQEIVQNSIHSEEELLIHLIRRAIFPFLPISSAPSSLQRG